MPQQRISLFDYRPIESIDAICISNEYKLRAANCETLADALALTYHDAVIEHGVSLVGWHAINALRNTPSDWG